MELQWILILEAFVVFQMTLLHYYKPNFNLNTGVFNCGISYVDHTLRFVEQIESLHYTDQNSPSFHVLN